jgi:hypothetical protein
MEQQTLSDLISDPAIGGQTLDWLQVFRAAKGYSYDDISTDYQYEAELALYDKAISRAKTLYANAKDQTSTADPKPVYGMSIATKVYDEANKSIKKQLVGTKYEVQSQVVTLNAGRSDQTTERWPVFDTSNSAGKILQAFQEYMGKSNKDEYQSMLYRRKGFHPYADKDGAFMAEIIDVEDDGHLLLRDDNGQLRRYAFKEVTFVI